MRKLLDTAFLITIFLLLTYTLPAQFNRLELSQNKQEKVDVPMRILVRPTKPSGRGCRSYKGAVRLGVTFDKSAKVTDVVILKNSSCAAFDENAVSSATKIVFSPAQKDGEAVTVTRVMEFSFYMY